MNGTVAKPDRAAMALANLIEQTARRVYDQRGPAHLHPVQWAALRYFERANRRARSVAGLAQYLDVTLGPASRTVGALKKHGLIETAKDRNDARISVVSLTKLGRETLQGDPIRRLASALQMLPSAEFQSVVQAITQANEVLTELSDDAGAANVR